MARRLTSHEVSTALIESHGLVAGAARRLGCQRSTIYRWCARDSTVRQALAEAREDLVDLAETALFKHIVAGKPWAIQFILKTQGSSRGYGNGSVVGRTLEKLSDEELREIAGEAAVVRCHSL